MVSAYIIAIARIIEEPRFNIFDDDIYFTTVKVDSEEFDNINLNFWGDLAYSVIENYQVDDYILVEGYISSQENEIYLDSSMLKKITITVLEAVLIY